MSSARCCPKSEKLQKVPDRWVMANPGAAKAPREALAAYADRSLPNLSSILVPAEVSGKRILLTGDARGDKVLQGLELVGLVDKGGKLRVDVLKCRHHGSSNHIDSDFFERIVADPNVFSGDGEFGNPERETPQMLAAARDKDDYRIHLPYPVDEIDVARPGGGGQAQAQVAARQAQHHGISSRQPRDPRQGRDTRPRRPHTIDLAG